MTPAKRVAAIKTTYDSFMASRDPLRTDQLGPPNVGIQRRPKAVRWNDGLGALPVPRRELLHYFFEIRELNLDWIEPEYCRVSNGIARRSSFGDDEYFSNVCSTANVVQVVGVGLRIVI